MYNATQPPPKRPRTDEEQYGSNGGGKGAYGGSPQKAAQGWRPQGGIPAPANGGGQQQPQSWAGKGGVRVPAPGAAGQAKGGCAPTAAAVQPPQQLQPQQSKGAKGGAQEQWGAPEGGAKGGAKGGKDGPVGGAAAGQQQPPRKDVFTAYVKRADDGEVDVSVRTLLGEYEEKGLNHGRKVYQKRTGAGDQAPGLDVLLYYWDERDGEAFTGWWFGNKLGGTQVWAHCKSTAEAPPPMGWQIPWNGYVRPDFGLARKEDKQAKEARHRLQTLTADFDATDTSVSAALTSARALPQDSVDTNALQELETQLSPQVLSLGEIEKTCADALRTAAEAASSGVVGCTDVMRELRQLGRKIQLRKEELTVQYTRIKTQRQKVIDDSQKASAEEKDQVVIDAMMPEATDRVDSAEDLSEKASIAFEMATSCADDEDALQFALAETEKAAKLAQVAIAEARRFLAARSKDTVGFSERTKEAADGALGKLGDQLQAAEKRLEPAVKARQSFSEKQEAQELIDQVERDLAMADLDVDRAEEAAILLGSDPSKEGLKRAERAVDSAEKRIEAGSKALLSRKNANPGRIAELLEEALGARARNARERLGRLRTDVKGGAESVAAASFLREAEEKLKVFVNAVDVLEDASRTADAALDDATGACGDDGQELKQLRSMEAKMKAPDSAAQAVDAASQLARSFLQMKLLEVKRFVSPACAEAKDGLLEAQRKFEQAAARAAGLKEGAAARKRQALMREGESKITAAEHHLTLLDESTTEFAAVGGVGLPDHMTVEEARERALSAAQKEKKVVEYLAEARKFLAVRQIEAKGRASAPGAQADVQTWAELQQRAVKAQATLGDLRKRYGTVEMRISARKALAEAEAKLQEAEAKVADAGVAADALTEAAAEDESRPRADGDKTTLASAPGGTAMKTAEVTLRDAHLQVRIVARQLESQARAQGGFAKDAIAALLPRLRRSEEQLEDASALVKSVSEKGFVRSVVAELKLKVDLSRQQLQAAEDAAKLLDVEQPDGPDAAIAKSRLALALERSVQTAQSSQSSAKTSLAMQRLAAKRLSASTAAEVEQELDSCQSEVDASGKRLSELRAKAVEVKMAALRMKK